MAAILPFLCCAATICFLFSRYPNWGLPRILLRAILICSLSLLLSIELLGRVRAITPWGLAIFWMAPTLAIGWLGLRSLTRRINSSAIGSTSQRLAGIDKVILGLVFLVIVAILVVAVVVPPNGYEVLHYHMSRVAHWAQNRTPAPYATGVETQNSRPPFADFALLTLLVLSGGDTLAALPQWLAMIGSLVGVALLTAEFLPGKSAVILAIVYAVTLPVGITQASSPEADYLVAFFAICLACEVITYAKGDRSLLPIIFSGIAAGLAVATKPSAIAFVLPILMFLGVLVVRYESLKAGLLSAVGIAAIVAVANMGAAYRNIELYGSLNDPTEIGIHANEMRNLRGLTSNLLRIMAANAWTPWPQFNDLVYRGVVKAHLVMAMDPSDPATTAHLPFEKRLLNYDTVDGNTLHAVLLLIAVLASLAYARRMPRYYFAYMASVFGGLILLSFLLKWQVFGNRYSLPFFILAAPLFAVSLGTWTPAWSYPPLAALLILCSLPWVLSLKERPLFRWPIDHGKRSILLRARQDMYFDSIPSRKDPYLRITALVRDSGCNAVGIAISGA